MSHNCSLRQNSRRCRYRQSVLRNQVVRHLHDYRTTPGHRTPSSSTTCISVNKTQMNKRKTDIDQQYI